MNMPTRPNAAKPPITPNITSRKGIRVALLITSGRIRLSTELTTSVPHSSKPMPSSVLPVNSSQAPSEPHTKGVPKGISATSAVSAPNSTGARTPVNQ